MRLFFLTLIYLVFTSFAHAQYKYLGPDGKVTYSDQPPPKEVKKVEQKNFTTNTLDSSNLPYAVQQAVQKFPVTLFSAEQCDPCNDARAYLKQRGIPFSEKTVKTNEDSAVLKQYSPERTVPTLVVGSQKSVGFLEAAWKNLLDSAGYPAISKLPANYQNPPAQSAAPAPNTAKDDTPKGPPPTTAPPAAPIPTPAPVPSNAPPGFRF